MPTQMPFLDLAAQGISQFNDLGISGILGGIVIIVVALLITNLGRDLAK